MFSHLRLLGWIQLVGRMQRQHWLKFNAWLPGVISIHLQLSFPRPRITSCRPSTTAACASHETANSSPSLPTCPANPQLRAASIPDSASSQTPCARAATGASTPPKYADPTPAPAAAFPDLPPLCALAAGRKNPACCRPILL